MSRTTEENTDLLKDLTPLLQTLGNTVQICTQLSQTNCTGNSYKSYLFILRSDMQQLQKELPLSLLELWQALRTLRSAQLPLLHRLLYTLFSSSKHYGSASLLTVSLFNLKKKKKSSYLLFISFDNFTSNFTHSFCLLYDISANMDLQKE